MSCNMPNGIPAQFDNKQLSTHDKIGMQYNGVGSQGSSRDSSPSVTRMQHIPASQLPPARSAIPTVQLPPRRDQHLTADQVAQEYARLNLSNESNATDKKVGTARLGVQGPTAFGTSTPESKNDQNVSQFKTHDFVSPISGSTPVKNPVTTNAAQSNTFSHSATSHFTNISRFSIKNASESDLNQLQPPTNANVLFSQSSDGLNTVHTNKQFHDQFTVSRDRSPEQNEKTQYIPRGEKAAQRNDASKVFGQHFGSKQCETVPREGHFTLGNVNVTVSNNMHPINASHPIPVLQQTYQQRVFGQYDKPTEIAQATVSDNQQRPKINSTGIQNINDNSKNVFDQYFSGSSQHAVPPTLNHPQDFAHVNANRANVNTMSAQATNKMQTVQGADRVDTLVQQTNSSYNFPAHQQMSAVFSRSQFQPSSTTPFGNNQNVMPIAVSGGNAISTTGGYDQPRPAMHSNRYPTSAAMQQIPLNSPNRYAPPSGASSGGFSMSQPTQAGNVKVTGGVMPQTMLQHPSNAPLQPSGTMQKTQPSGMMQQTYKSPSPYTQVNHSPHVGQQMSPYHNQHHLNYQDYNNRMSVTQSGFNKLWGMESYDLLQTVNVLPPTGVEVPIVCLEPGFPTQINCSPDIFRCTLTKIPDSNNLLQKSRLPLGLLIHPFRDLENLAVVQCNTIVRCRACRTYINPFVYFVDSKRWKCNLCYRVNELPEEFQYDPLSKTYGDPSRRPEVKTSTIEYIAPAEYMLRPPQPAVYLYLFDVSRLAVETGYLHTVCNILNEELNNLPGDARTHIGFLAYDSALHFYSLSEGQSQPHEMTVLDVEDVFLPCPENLLVNLQSRLTLVADLLSQLPRKFVNSYDNGSALGAALQAAYKMMSGTGGRITVFQTCLPSVGPGALTPREDPNQRASSDVPHLNPANDFYKRLALECSGQQIAVDLFILNSQYVDLATVSGIGKFSGGCIHHVPLYKSNRTLQDEALANTFRRYVTRKIGFESVMRVRCTRGLSIQTFHGNLFVRSTDLLSLPNINPDAGFGMQVAIEESLSDVQTVCFQAALLYTSSKGERRIRVHTMCIPVASTLTDIVNSADQQCIIGLLAKMAVDRSTQSSLSDAREAFLNVVIDVLSSYKLSMNMSAGPSGLNVPGCLKLLPLYVSALLKNVAFRIGTSTRLDDRVKAMCDMKTKPLRYLIQQIYPDFYPVHNLEQQKAIIVAEDQQVHVPPLLQLTARNFDSNGAYLLDSGEHMLLFVCSGVSSMFLVQILGTSSFGTIKDDMYEIPVLDNEDNRRLRMFVSYLNRRRPFPATLQVVRDNSANRHLVLERLIEDRMENSLSYHEFLQHVKTQVK